jgi:hypothetical protein
MPARVQGLVLGLGSAKQTSVTSISSTFNRWRKLNMDLPFLRPGTETDEDEIGKGTEFITQVFKTAKNTSGRIEKYGSAEFTCWAWAYGMGVCGLSTGLYTIHAIDPGITLEPPYFTLVAQLAEGGGSAFDEAHIGCVIQEVETAFHYGPGRASLRTTASYWGGGNSVLPSGVVVPATLSEDYMLSSSATVSINGIDYVAGTPGAKTILSGTITWQNDILTALAYFPGSGIDSDGFAIGARSFAGKRKIGFTFTALLQHDSTEYSKLVSQTSGSATISFTFDSTHYVQFFFPVVTFEMVERTQESGIVAVTITVAPHYDSTVVGGLANGVLVVTSKNAITDCCQ